MEDKQMSELESLQVISTMIQKAKASYHDKGTGAILWGVVITICSMSTWAQLQYKYELPFDIWLLTLAAVVPTIILSVRESRRRKVKGYDETAMNWVWTCFGISIFLVVHTSNAVGAAFGEVKNAVEAAGGTRPAIYYSDYSSAFMLIVYGIPTLVSAGIKKFKPMLIGGIVCWVSAVAVVYTDRATDMLLMALSATCAWLIPGLILFVKSRKLQAA